MQSGRHAGPRPDLRPRTAAWLGLPLVVLISLSFLCLGTALGEAEVLVDLEGGAVLPGYNDVRIPGTTGTLFSLSEDLDIDPGAFVRARLSYVFGGRNTVSLLIAPLSAKPTGQIPKDVEFEGVVFPAGTPLNATYRFDSYRLTYRREIYNSDKLDIGLGGTAKIRSAEISLRGAGLSSKKTNTGLVPLLNFRLSWNLREQLRIVLEGDALAAPQGRAEDVMAAVVYRVTDRAWLRIGYRILEGGADNDEVYSFALFHYAACGLTIEL